MEIPLIAYNLLFPLLLPGLPPVWLGSRLARRWDHLWPRLGLFGHLAPPAPGPRVWLQAVSRGEVGVAAAIAAELWRRRPEVRLTVSTSTDTGLAEAREVLGERAVVAPFPLDVPWAAWAAARRIRPVVYASLETEIWPNLLWFLERQGASLLLLNGRLSPRSFPRYRKIRCLLAPSLRRFAVLSMIGEQDAQRIQALGAPPERIRVDGNAKYAGLLHKARPELLEEPAARLGEPAPLLVAGSARSGEERPVLEGFRRVLEEFPAAVLAVAPRHVEKSRRWVAACRELGLTVQRWSELSPAQPRRADTRVVVVDAMGVLMGLYGLAADRGGAAFLGASLVPLGGQNPLEPAAWGLACCFGPSMEDFLDAAGELLAAGAAWRVTDAAELAAFWSQMLRDPAAARQAGRAGRQVVAKSTGAAAVAAELILEQLERKGALS